MKEASSAFAALLVKGGGTVLAFALIWASARLLSSDDFASLALILSLVPLLTILGSGGRQFGYARALKGLAKAVPLRFLRPLAPSILLPALLAGGAAVVLVWLIPPPEALAPAGQLALVVVVGGLSVLMALSGISRGLGRAAEASLGQDATWRMGALAILLAVTGYSSSLNLGGLLIVFALAVCLAVAQHLVLLTGRQRHRPVLDQAVLSSANRYHLFVVGVSLVQIGGQQIDVILLGLLQASVLEIGAYFAALRIGLAPTMLLVAANAVAGPLLARLSDSFDFTDFSKRVGLIYTAVLIASILYVLAVFLFADRVLGLFNPEFSAYADLVRVLSVGFLLNVMAGPTGVYFVMRGSERPLVGFLAIMLLCQASLIILMFQYFGVLGAALANLTMQVIINACLWLYIKLRHRRDVSVFSIIWLWRVGDLER